MWRTASTTLPVPASPLVRIIAAPSPIRRSASPRSRAPQTNGTVNACLSTWFGFVGRREHLALVDVVDPQRLQDLRLDEVPDAALGHHRECVTAAMIVSMIVGSLMRATPPAARMSAGTRSSAITAHGAGLLGDPRLLGRRDVHDHAALQHLARAPP